MNKKNILIGIVIVGLILIGFFFRGPKKTNEITSNNYVNKSSEYLKAISVVFDDLGKGDKIITQAKNAGANTILLYLPVILETEPSEISSAAGKIISQIQKANLSVGIVADIILSKDKEKKITYNEAIQLIDQATKEYADLAQKNNLTYFQVAYEINNVLTNIKTEKETTQELIKNIQTIASSVYKGRLGIGFDPCRGKTPDDCQLENFNYDISGFDFITVQIYLSGNETDIIDPVGQYIGYMEPIINATKTLAEKSKVKNIFFTVNAGNIWEKDKKNCDGFTQLCYPLKKEDQLAFYNQVMAKTKAMVINGMIIPDYALFDQSVSAVIKTGFK